MFGKHHQDETKELLREANRKEVQQWSRDGFELLRTFRSIEEAAAESGADGSHITKVCKGERKTAGGFHWKFVNHEDSQANKVIKFTNLQQWSFDGLTLVGEYATFKEASEKTGVDKSRIGRCCKGKGRLAGGFKWKVVV
jgi:hypothetical protein